MSGQMADDRWQMLCRGSRALALAAVCHLPSAICLAQDRSEQRPEAFTIADIMSAPFPAELVSSPDGRAVAWIGNEEGRRNVWVAQAPSYRARRLTSYSADDGQPLSALTWAGDSRALVYVRGGAPGSNWDVNVPVSPTSDAAGGEQVLWLVRLAGGAPRRLGDGHTPVASPNGERLLFLLRDTIRTVSLRTAGAAQVLLRARGQSARPVWSPDGRQVAFVSRRGDHSFIGVFEVARRQIRWIAPGTWRDDFPRWSPDGKLAWIRRSGQTFNQGAPLPQPAPGNAPAPFTIVVADSLGAVAREVYRSPAGADGNLPGNAGEWSLQWADANGLLFGSEQTGWLGLYHVSAQGGAATRLTPERCEIQNVERDDASGSVLFDSNCGDIDRRHVQRINLASREVSAGSSGRRRRWPTAR